MSTTEDNLEESFQKIGLTTEETSTPSTLEPENSLPTETKINVPKPVVETSDESPALGTTLNTLLPSETSQNSHTSVSSNTQHLQFHTHSTPSNFAEAQTTPVTNASIVLPGVKEQSQSQKENIVESDDNTSKQPNDYLESSEALLRSLAEEEPKTHKPSNSNNGLLSPLGIGSMLLLLLASFTLGYVVFNPKSLPQFSFSGLFQQNAPTTAENTTATTVEGNKNVKTVAQPTFTPIPNLVTKESPEVRNPNDVVGLKPKSESTPTASPNPGATQNPINPVPIPNVQPPLGQDSASPSTLEIPQKPNTQIKPSADGFYHVVIDNQGDRTFASARQAVPDAYLSSDGKIIYLGALKSKEQAEKLLQELQAKGVKAKIEQP
jgi:hypothetical protein